MESREKDLMPASKKKVLLVGLAILIIAALVVLALSMKKTNGPSSETPGGNEQQSGTPTEVDEEGNEIMDASVDFESDELQEVEIIDLEDVKVVVPGANPITKDNKVVTMEGEITDSAAIPMAEEAPKQTGFLVREELPENIVQLEVGNDKFSPSQFITKVGDPTTFSLTSVNDFVHVINFDDPAVAAISILVGPGQTKAITFNAPTEPGEYTFRCSVPGHAEKGEVGKMIVR